MIHKIEKLTCIGKFRNYQANGDVAFKKLTLFYADNRGGKTTLTAILRSLTQNKPELVFERKSINANVPQSAQIKQINNSNYICHTFHHTKGWTTPFPDIEIFDIHFVNENIYSGFTFDETHKKQLHQFVIGSGENAIRKKIEQNDKDKETTRQNQKQLKEQLIAQVGNNLTVDTISDFLKITLNQANNINQLIANAETDLANANSNNNIQSLKLLSNFTQIKSNIDFKSLLTDLQTTSETIQDNILQTLFTTHCKDLSDNKIESPENWLNSGFDYLKSRIANSNDSSAILSCPFCRQSVNNDLEIIKAYTLKFNIAFNELVQRIESHLTALQNFNLETAIQALNNVNNANKDFISLWSTHLPNTVQAPTFNINSDNCNLKTRFQELILLVKLKSQNPSVTQPTTKASAFQTALQTINTNIDSYNQSIKTYNENITSFRTGIQTIAQAQLEVDKLKRIKKRFEPAINTLCQELENEEKNDSNLRKEYTKLNTQFETETITFLSNYEVRINYYLTNIFKTPFKIEKVVHKRPQGKEKESKIDYKLTIDGQDIFFDPAQQNSVKVCLSEGDKSTIALSFFLSKLDIDDTNIANKVLVFDDPLSSFDRNRRFNTVRHIKELFSKVKQIIIFSHNEIFINNLSEFINTKEEKTLQISNNPNLNSSEIIPMDLKDLVKTEYFENINRLENFLQNPTHTEKEDILGLLRKVLESYIRFRFYVQLKHLKIQNSTFGNLIKGLENSKIVLRENSEKTSIISLLETINRISWRPHHGNDIPSAPNTITDSNDITLDELCGFIKDTIGLIENKL